MEKSYIEGLNAKSREDILDFIEEAARQYTPEWRFDRENPDAGTALACVYGDIFVKMLGRFNRVLEKNKIEFFNHLNAHVLPPVPSSGYAVFSMVNDTVGGTQIPAGMGVYGDLPEGGASFRTEDDVYATPAKPEAIFHVWDSRDMIKQVYKSGEEQKELHPFDMPGENLQSHELYFSSDTVLNIHKEATIELVLYARGEVPVPEPMVQRLLGRENAVFEYYSSKGWEELRPALAGSKNLLFYKSEFSPAFERLEISGHESFWIRCRVIKMPLFEDFSFENAYIKSKGVYLAPDVINGNGIECNIAEYVPFGERFGLYNEVYFACDEALSKCGSQIDFSFTMDFLRVPLTDADTGDATQWNWIMKKSDFKVDREYDLTIEEVLWEYYNGSGWSRLFNDSSYCDLFSADQGVRSQYRTMRFTCPDDMCPVLINSREARFIRARIIKINNLYKNKGYYVSPILSDTVFSYDYASHLKMPGRIYIRNNLEEQMYAGSEPGGAGGRLTPFYTMGLKENAVYIGFNAPLNQGPVKILFTMLENITGSHPRLLWEYYGSRGFSELNLVDETDSLSKTGIVTIMGEPDFVQKQLFGQKLYWIRIVDEAGYFSRKTEHTVYPCITSIHMNVVRVTNVDVEETEYFFTERYEENKTLKLLHPHVIGLEVWVDEAGHLSESQRLELSDERDVECTWSESGVLENVWVRWSETEDFIGADSHSRCFCADRSAGTITFGNGKYGKIISPSRKENIRVSYRCGGGEQTNLPAGAIQRMEYSAGFVSGVTNPHRLLGGCGQESLEDALRRCCGTVRNHYKAVTCSDFEQLAIEASRSVRRVKCFTGYDGSGRRCPGAMTLVVLQKEFENGRYVFNDIKEQIYGRLKACTDGQLISGGRLFVTEPEFVEICTRLELTARSFNVVFQIKKDIEMLLSRFLNPLTGHFDGKGWPIGSLPAVVQIQNLLRNIRGVKYIKNVYLTGYVTGSSGREEVELGKIREHPFILPLGGKHDIIIRVDG